MSFVATFTGCRTLDDIKKKKLFADVLFPSEVYSGVKLSISLLLALFTIWSEARGN